MINLEKLAEYISPEIGGISNLGRSERGLMVGGEWGDIGGEVVINWIGGGGGGADSKGNGGGGEVAFSSFVSFTIISVIMDHWDAKDFCNMSKVSTCCDTVEHNESNLERTMLC